MFVGLFVPVGTLGRSRSEPNITDDPDRERDANEQHAQADATQSKVYRGHPFSAFVRDPLVPSLASKTNEHAQADRTAEKEQYRAERPTD